MMIFKRETMTKTGANPQETETNISLSFVNGSSVFLWIAQLFYKMFIAITLQRVLAIEPSKETKLWWSFDMFTLS